MGIAWGNIQEISVFQQGRDSKGLKKYYIKHFNLEYIIKGIKAKNIDDLADSFLQIFGFIQFIQFIQK